MPKELAAPKRRNFTDTMVRSLQPIDGKETVFWDTNLPGFGMRVSPKGRRTFIVQYRVRGARGGSTKWVERQETLGTLADLGTLKAARDKARERRVRAQDGTDPVGERKAAQEAERAEQAAKTFTFAKVADRYQTEYADLNTKASSASETKRLLGRWSAVLGDRPVADIKKADIMAFLNDRQMGKNGRGRVEGNNLLGAVKHLFRWAKEQDLVDSNPADNVAKPLARVQARDRYLTDDEIKLFWVGCDQVGWPAGRILQVLLLTGQRLNEVAQMAWSELDLSNRIWHLPAERAKNGRAHTIHLNDLAMEIFAGLPQINSSELIFTIHGDVPFIGFEYVRNKVARHMGDTPHWRIHDLRQTATTLMARLGIPPHVADKVLNHQSGTISGVAAVYNRFEYLDERKAALEALGKFVERLIGRNVVSMRTTG